jgi:hypothetical protein
MGIHAQDFAEVPPEGLSEGPPPPPLAQLSLFERPASGDPADNLVFGYRLSGALDTSALRAAFTEVVSRYEALRTPIVTTADEPRRVVDMASAVAVAVQDVSAVADPVSQARRLAEAELRIPFDLQAGPLLRVQLYRLGEDDHVLVIAAHHIAAHHIAAHHIAAHHIAAHHIAAHHIAADGSSMAVFESELGECYRAFAEGRPSPLSPPDIQSTDFTPWQRPMLSDEGVEGVLRYWRERLRDLPEPLELPVDRPRPSTPTYTAGVVSFDVPEDVAVRLRALPQSRTPRCRW